MIAGVAQEVRRPQIIEQHFAQCFALAVVVAHTIPCDSKRLVEACQLAASVRAASEKLSKGIHAYV